MKRRRINAWLYGFMPRVAIAHGSTLPYQEGDTTQIQESVDMVDIWTNQNDMRLNSEKCKEIIKDFSRNYSLTSGIQSVTVGEQVLERVEHANILA